MSVIIDGLEQAQERLSQLVKRADRGRRLLGIIGAPGAGKSTLSKALLEVGGPDAAMVPMDGFHFDNEALDRLGRRARKGAPDTFDVAGYVAALERIRRRDEVYVPRFDRTKDAAVAGAIVVPPTIPLVITEGNYLLMESGGWERVAPLLDEVWYLDIDDELRRRRLVARHMSFGRSERDAREWVERVDEVNAAAIISAAERADVIVRLTSVDC